MFFKGELNPDLNLLLKDKRVAVVGPAHYLTGLGYGGLIDNYDVVVRPNQFSFPVDLHEDYGCRTDIMFHNCGTPWMPGLKEQVEQNPKDFAKLKMAVCPVIKADHSEGDFMSWPNDHVSACATNFTQVNKNDIPFYWVGVENYREVYKQVGHEPYTGVMTICALLCYPIQELYVTGFDFYSGERVYYDGALSSFDTKCERRAANGGTHGLDSNRAQVRFLKNLFLRSDLLKADDKLRELLLGPVGCCDV